MAPIERVNELLAGDLVHELLGHLEDEGLLEQDLVVRAVLSVGDAEFVADTEVLRSAGGSGPRM